MFSSSFNTGNMIGQMIGVMAFSKRNSNPFMLGLLSGGFGFGGLGLGGSNYAGLLRGHLDSQSGSAHRWNSIMDDLRHFSIGGFSGGYDPTMGLRLNNGGINGLVFSKINDAVTTYNYNRNDYLSSFNGFNKLGSLSTLVTNDNTSIGNGNFGWMQNGGLSGIFGTNFGNQTDNVDQKKYNAKIALIKQYAAVMEDNKIMDDVKNNILKDITDPKEACKKLDEYMKKLDPTALKLAAKKIAPFEKKLETGKTISDTWKKTMGNLSTTPDSSAKVATNNLSGENILDVLGTYISGFTEGQRKDMWDSLLREDSNFAEISTKLIIKARDMVGKYSDKESTINAAVGKLNSASDTDKPTACYELFDCLRKIEAENYAKEFSETSGLPEDIAASIENPALKNYNKEKEAWNNANRFVSVEA